MARTSFVARYDFRAPGATPAERSELFGRAVEQAAYAEQHGIQALMLSEHHVSADGYLPSALTMAAAVAARTSRVATWVSAVAAPFHDPVRLAEEAVVVDSISAGRLTLVLANGYVPSEFDMFGVPIGERVARTTEAVLAVRAARDGAPVQVGERSVKVTPAPDRRNGRTGPTVLLGGSGPAAARRAARIARSRRTSRAPWR